MRARVYFDDCTIRQFTAEEPLPPAYRFPIPVDFLNIVRNGNEAAILRHKQATLAGVIDGVAIYIEEK